MKPNYVGEAMLQKEYLPVSGGLFSQLFGELHLDEFVDSVYYLVKERSVQVFFNRAEREEVLQ